MRDVIWTIIVIWLVYKCIDLFRGLQSKAGARNMNHQQSDPSPQKSAQQQNIQSAMKKSADNEGEYIDFEEIK